MRKSGFAHSLKPTFAVLLTIVTGLLLAGCPGKKQSGIATGPKAEALLSPARRQVLDGLKKQSTQPVKIVVDAGTRAVLYLGMSYPTGSIPGSPGFTEKANAVVQSILPLLDTQLNSTEIV